jgi:hypothetical protein
MQSQSPTIHVRQQGTSPLAHVALALHMKSLNQKDVCRYQPKPHQHQECNLVSSEQRAELTIFFSFKMKFGLEMVTVCNTVESLKNILKKVSN